jgi:lipopolysaccharide transport system ATP-binding protein
MGDTVIRVENLSKKYVLSHQQEGQKYKALRDVIADGAKSLVKPFTQNSKFNPQNSSKEEFWALKDVSFEIKQGDRVGIIGRNGAGKSTLLKILSRITEPTSGRIQIQGRVASLLEVGTGFHPELTGRENIFLNGAILGMSKAEIKRKFDEIVAFAEVEKFLDTPVKRYSSGMYVRLAFAVAAHLEPEILIVDEVLAVGDAAFQKKCLNKMDEVADEGRTVLFVSHNIAAMHTLCTDAVYLEKGKIKALGEADKILTDYTSELLQPKQNDLADLRLSGYGKQIRFTDISLLSNGEQHLLFGQPITYSLTIHSDIAVENLSIGASIFTQDGKCIGNLITDESFSVEADQTLTLQLSIPNINLAPGSYYAGVSIGQGTLRDTNRRDLDVVIGKPSFQVLSISQNEEPIANWHSTWGNIVIQGAKMTVINDHYCIPYKA